MTITVPGVVVQFDGRHLGGQKLHKRLGRRQRLQLVAIEFQRLQRAKAAEGVRLEVHQLVGRQVQMIEAAERQEGARLDLAYSIARQREAPQAGRLGERLRGHRRQTIVGQIKLD